jgi:hypothetical protein
MSKPFTIVTGAGVLAEQHRRMVEPGFAKKAES